MGVQSNFKIEYLSLTVAIYKLSIIWTPQESVISIYYCYFFTIILAVT